MAFVSIGSLATNVLHKARLQAAANEAPRMGGDGPMSQGEGEPLSPSPMLKAGEEATEQTELVASGKDGDPAQRVARGVRQTTRTARANVASLPTFDRCERIASPNATSPVAAMRSHLLRELLRHDAPRSRVAASSRPPLYASISASMP